eukprot:TRINITY_DN7524_c0_g2_i1.p1 TRINITY_DN7524_c0_g2~~TRINITY_DN7524_c0_g2_i1.p1  ORF type:complete len:648 (-),score=197.93 TRINITY_DN7524_c0_g2_i1:67-2010(-)
MTSTLAIRHLTCPDISDRELLLYKFITSVEGRPFTNDLTTLINARLHNNTTEEEDSFFCSGLVAAAYHSMELVSKDFVTSNFLPKNWASFNQLENNASLGRKHIFRAKTCIRARPVLADSLMTDEFLALKPEEFKALKNRDGLSISRRLNKLNDWTEWEKKQRTLKAIGAIPNNSSNNSTSNQAMLDLSSSHRQTLYDKHSKRKSMPAKPYNNPTSVKTEKATKQRTSKDDLGVINSGTTTKLTPDPKDSEERRQRRLSQLKQPLYYQALSENQINSNSPSTTTQEVVSYDSPRNTSPTNSTTLPTTSVTDYSIHESMKKTYPGRIQKKKRPMSHDGRHAQPKKKTTSTTTTTTTTTNSNNDVSLSPPKPGSPGLGFKNSLPPRLGTYSQELANLQSYSQSHPNNSPSTTSGIMMTQQLPLPPLLSKKSKSFGEGDKVGESSVLLPLNITRSINTSSSSSTDYEIVGEYEPYEEFNEDDYDDDEDDDSDYDSDNEDSFESTSDLVESDDCDDDQVVIKKKPDSLLIVAKEFNPKESDHYIIAEESSESKTDEASMMFDVIVPISMPSLSSPPPHILSTPTPAPPVSTNALPHPTITTTIPSPPPTMTELSKESSTRQSSSSSMNSSIVLPNLPSSDSYDALFGNIEI